MNEARAIIQGMDDWLEDYYTKGDSKLELKESNKDGVKVGIRKDGTKYSVRDDRRRFFFPNEWNNFYDSLENDKQRITMDMLINTGARISEAMFVKVKDINFDKGIMTFLKTKIKASKGETKCKPRTIKISTQFRDQLAFHCASKNTNDSIGMLSKQQTGNIIKKHCKLSGIKDYWNFSPHNLRKTHGNWLKCLGVDGMEICQRLGHDMGTFLGSYGSPDIFSKEDKEKIKQLVGDIV